MGEAAGDLVAEEGSLTVEFGLEGQSPGGGEDEGVFVAEGGPGVVAEEEASEAVVGPADFEARVHQKTGLESKKGVGSESLGFEGGGRGAAGEFEAGTDEGLFVGGGEGEEGRQGVVSSREGRVAQGQAAPERAGQVELVAVSQGHRVEGQGSFAGGCLQLDAVENGAEGTHGVHLGEALGLEDQVGRVGDFDLAHYLGPKMVSSR